MKFEIKNIMNLIDSLKINYKSWIVIIISFFFINPSNVGGSLFTFLVMIVIVHVVHYFAHCESAYPGNLVHLYHHDNNNWFSHFIQIILEFVALTSVVLIKNFSGTGIFYKYFAQFMDEWIIWFSYIFYTTVHNINYSYFHVNKVHELHHKLKVKNIGPDVCDVLFGTKHDVENDLENTDHYIPNVAVSSFLVWFMKYIWNSSENKEAYIVIFCVIFAVSSILLLETMMVLYIQKTMNATKDPYTVPTKSCDNV